MPLILLIVLLALLRFFELGPFAALSWWWIAGLFAAAFIWFEIIEKMLGLDKKKSTDDVEKTRQKRIRNLK